MLFRAAVVASLIVVGCSSAPTPRENTETTDEALTFLAGGSITIHTGDVGLAWARIRAPRLGACIATRRNVATTERGFRWHSRRPLQLQRRNRSIPIQREDEPSEEGGHLTMTLKMEEPG